MATTPAVRKHLPKTTKAELASTDKELLRAQRDVAYALFTAMHDQVEALEWAAGDAHRHFVALIRFVEQARNLWDGCEKECAKYTKLAESARQRLAKAEAVWSRLHAQAARAGLGEDYGQDEGLERIKHSKDLRELGDLTRRLSLEAIGVKRARKAGAVRP
jgi:hypothetical protein